MNILITGGFGNMGRSCADTLLKLGQHVRVLDLPSPANQVTAKKLPQVEAFWGDVRDEARVNSAVAGQDVIIHLAAIIPPGSNANPQLAEAVNVGGTRNLIAAAQAQARPPKILFSSTFDLYGPTQHLPPPRKVGDPLQATDDYSQHKLICEGLIQASGLTWAIFRLSDVPMIILRDPDPIMFEIPLDTRMETMHPRDAGLALARAAVSEQVWGRILNVGGGKACQVTYREFLWGMLNNMGIGELPEAAFTSKPYCTDWLDTAESQQLFNYQRHSFDDILKEISALLGWRRLFVPLAKPFVRRSILKMSPYWQASRQ